MTTAIVTHCDVESERYGLTVMINFDFGGISQGAPAMGFYRADLTEYLTRLLAFFRVTRLSQVKGKVCVVERGKGGMISILRRLPHEEEGFMELTSVATLVAK